MSTAARLTDAQSLVDLGSILIPPKVHILYETNGGEKDSVEIIVNTPVPYRSLTYPDGQFTIARDSADFYFEQGERLPVRIYSSIRPAAGFRTPGAH
jgi:hypothetical protein